MTASEGIFKPRQMSGVLSVKTVVPGPGGRVWYHDQGSPSFVDDGEVMSYAFSGTDPASHRNQYLKDAMARQLPIIYFFGVAPRRYEPHYPTFVSNWLPDQLSCRLSFGAETIIDPGLPEQPLDERRYAPRTVQQRMHQSMFRERVLSAYGHRCALSGLPEPRLIDAVHIVRDSDALGKPVVNNGICMSKIHHAAYDANLIGIDADLQLHVSEKLLDIHDGPFLEYGLKSLVGRKLRVPEDSSAAPDSTRLARHFEDFTATT